MSKLKKMLMISSLILLASCDSGIPDPPEALSVSPIWHDENIIYFYGRWMKAGDKVQLNMSQAKAAALTCTDSDSWDRQELYVRQLKELAKKRCK